MKYKQMGEPDRAVISQMRKSGKDLTTIANCLGRHKSTISREIKRNRSAYDESYRYHRAQEKTNARRRATRKKSQFNEEEWSKVIELINKKWSPEQISGHLKVENKMKISHETIYRYIWRDKKMGGELYKQLRWSAKKRIKRRGSYDSRGRLEGKTMIGDRPLIVAERSRKGDWEIDTVHGGCKASIVTLVERRTGYVMIGKVKDLTVREVSKVTIDLMKRYPKLFLTVTADNGSEFHGYKEIEKESGAKFYFATPHHSWERGSNENTNGLIRQYLPKRKSMLDITQEDCDMIAEKLNQRPRKRHGFSTPNQCFLENAPCCTSKLNLSRKCIRYRCAILL